LSVKTVKSDKGRLLKWALGTGIVLLALYLILVVVVFLVQRSLLFFPSHEARSGELVPWRDGERTIGFCHEVPNPGAVWLMMHGNAGQAANRGYVLSHLSEHDSFYVLEYPGYGLRAGHPSRESMNQAAAQAYRLLRASHPAIPVCVLGESIGSGPACALALEKVPPDKIALVVPFDKLASVASEHMRFLPAGLLLRDRWNNVESLRPYTGPVEIFGATGDGIIPVEHAKALARQVPSAHFTEIPGGHNDWSSQREVQLRP
jgi:pimeloyl-ACP methyl ester carboxylesterase